MSRMFRCICAASVLSLMSACGGGGGGGDSAPRDPPAPGVPTVSLTASATSVTIGQVVTLSWTSTNATSCVASGGWSGTRPTTGAEQISALVSDATFTLACSGAGGSANGQVSVTVQQPAPTEVVLSGRITFDRPPFAATPGGGLDLNNPVVSPARRILVEAVAAGAVRASTVTDANGQYAMTVPANLNMFIQAKAQMRKTDAAPTWDFQVLNNANADALYALRGSDFNSGATNITIDLHAPTGWTGATYDATRAAAPFAILDAARHAMELILTANPAAQFAPLNFFWSNQNRTAVGPFCPDRGDIGTTSYVVFSTAQPSDGCDQPGMTGIYVLGEFSANGDTDEFDPHVIVHEFGHYFEHRFSRSDSIGGEHSLEEGLDLRLAFGEGWGNAFSGMALGDPVYRDSFIGVSQSFSFDMESDGAAQPRGWYSEASVARILWDVFDPANEPGDQLAAGFGPIYAVMTGPQRQTEAYTSIFSFARALRSVSGVSSSAVGALLTKEQINGTGDFGEGETNSAGLAGLLPVFEPVAVGEMKPFCTQVAGGAELNKLGNRKFFRFDVGAGGALVTIQVNGDASGGRTPAVDPDILIARRGSIRAIGFSPVVGQETMSQVPLEAGTHIIEVIDSDQAGTAGARCMTLSISGG